MIDSESRVLAGSGQFTVVSVYIDSDWMMVND